jgi:hypothetical protein
MFMVCAHQETGLLWPEREREESWGVVVRDTTVWRGVVTETYFGCLEGSQAVPASPSGKGFDQL